MARRAIAVNDRQGIYDFVLGANPQSYTEVRRDSTAIEVIEQLMGWGPWRWAVRTDTGTYFVDGASEPRERVPHA